MKSTERLADSLQFSEGWKAKKAVWEICEPADANSNTQSKDGDCVTEVEALSRLPEDLSMSIDYGSYLKQSFFKVVKLPSSWRRCQLPNPLP